MGITSPFLLAKQLETHVIGLLRHVDITELDSKQQKAIRELKRGLVDARLDIQDYELAETRELQLKNAREARERFESVQALISANIITTFGPVDVAHLTACIDQITDKLR